MRVADLAWLAAGIVLGLVFGGVLLLHQMVEHHEEARLAAARALVEERRARCTAGQHRELVVVKTVYMHVRCLDCAWTEELGIAYSTGTNKRTRRVR